MNHCHILWNILYTISLLYGLFNFLPQSSLATGKSSVSREIFRIPRGNLFLSFGQQREAFLPYYDGYSCVFGRTRVCSVDRPLRISRGISKIVLLTAVFAAFSWRTARKPDRCFFFFFGSAISPTRLSNTNHSIGRAWHRTFPPTLWSSLGLFVTCMASFIRFIRMWRARESEGKRFRGFRTTSLIYSSKLARNLENKREMFPRNFGKDGLYFFFFCN